MAAQHHRLALWLLLPVNLLALAAGLAVAQGAVALPTAPPPLVAAPAAALPDVALPAVGFSEAEVHPRQTLAPIRITPRAAPRPVPKATPGIHPKPLRAARVRPPTRTFEQDLKRQIARIPLYRPQIVRWVVVPDLAVYGVTSLRTRTVYLSPRIPRRLLYSVVAHEWGHVISTYAYGSDLRISQQAFKEWFGGGSMRAATERAADCIAVLLGASWTHYTSCRNEHWRLGALYLANGMKLPAQ